ncbi:MAG: hypothetical protein PHP41_02395 [Bacilli bacterium]|nr:hypothetical protein [Bacilli bacterium]
MKSRKKFPIKKLIFLAIVTLIPLLASYFIGIYSYNRYEPTFFNEYMDSAEETTEDKIHAYLKYATYAYEKEPYFEKTIKNTNNNNDAALFQIYRGITSEESRDDDNEIVITYKVKYYFAVYNINYTEIIAIKDPTGEEKLTYNSLPSMYVKITDVNEDTYKTSASLGIPGDEVLIDDYLSTPDEDYRGRELNSKYLKWVELTPSDAFSDEVTIELIIADASSEGSASYYVVMDTITKNDFTRNIDDFDFDTLEEGFEFNNQEAGYFSYVFKTKIWWQSLIAFVLIGFITYSFYFVWQAEEMMSKKKEKK